MKRKAIFFFQTAILFATLLWTLEGHSASSKKVCHLFLSDYALLRDIQVKKGDLVLARIDVTSLFQTAPTETELKRSHFGRNLFKTSVDGSVSILSTRGLQVSPKGIEFLALLKAEELGQGSFSTFRKLRVAVSKQEMGTEDIAFLRSLLDVGKALRARGSYAGLASELASNGRFGSPVLRSFVEDLGEYQSTRNEAQNEELFRQLVLGARNILEPTTYETREVHGNRVTLQVSNDRNGGNWGNIHRVGNERQSEKVSVGDVLIVEVSASLEKDDSGLKFKYDPPLLKFDNLTQIFTEQLEPINLPAHHSFRKRRHYFLATSPGRAEIKVSAPPLNQYPNPAAEWVKSIVLEVEPRNP